jgi:hypothetical protein
MLIRSDTEKIFTGCLKHGDGGILNSKGWGTSVISMFMAAAVDMKETRRKVKEISEKELIREAIRARKFSGFDSLRQGMNLIDFALRVNRDHVSSVKRKILE